MQRPGNLERDWYSATRQRQDHHIRPSPVLDHSGSQPLACLKSISKEHGRDLL